MLTSQRTKEYHDRSSYLCNASAASLRSYKD